MAELLEILATVLSVWVVTFIIMAMAVAYFNRRRF
jgi:hypothetical protein